MPSFLGGAYHFDGLDDALYARNESCRIDSECGLGDFFLKHIVQQRPVVCQLMVIITLYIRRD